MNSKIVKKIKKPFSCLDKNIQYLLMVGVVILVISLVWPCSRNVGVRLVPSANGSYKAYLEGFSNYFTPYEEYKTNDNGKPVFVAYMASWCGYCKKLKPEWDKFIKENTQDINIYTVDAAGDKNWKTIVEKNNIKGYPTILYYKDGDLESTNSEPCSERTAEKLLSFVNSKFKK